jgi:hypothetical protein
MDLKDKLKKVTAAGTGGMGIVGLFFMLHGDIKAEIKSSLKKIENVVSRVTVLETREKIIWEQVKEDLTEIKEDVKYLKRKK